MAKRGMTPEQAKILRKKRGIEDTPLQRIRVSRGLSQNDLALRSGISKPTIQGYEQRQRAIDKAQYKTLCALALALDCQVEDFLEDETEKTS